MKYLFAYLPLLIFANTLSVDEVLTYTRKNFLKIRQAQQKVLSQQSKVEAAGAAFNPFFDAEYNSNLEGYYDGDVLDAKVTKPFQSLGAKLYLGARESYGQFPVYDADSKTLKQGELRAGVELSLLRGRAIDSKRAKLQNELLGSNIAVAEQKQIVMDTLYEAYTSYWRWVAAYKTLKVYEEMLELADIRQKALTKRVRRGDLAAIYITESNQYLVQRKSQVIEAQQKLSVAQIELSMYFPQIRRGQYQGPKLLEVENQSLWSTQKLEHILELNPLVERLTKQVLQVQNDIDLNQNASLPELNLKFESSKDMGQGDKSLSQPRQKALLSLNIPLGDNPGDGLRDAAKFKRKSLELNKEFVELKIKNLFEKLKIYLETTKNRVALAKQEMDIARKVRIAENKKFRNGASDLFVLNLRDQNEAKAAVGYYKEFFKFKLYLADYKRLALLF